MGSLFLKILEVLFQRDDFCRFDFHLADLFDSLGLFLGSGRNLPHQFGTINIYLVPFKKGANPIFFIIN